jgi:hypothetical protein
MNLKIIPDPRHKDIGEDLALALMKAGHNITETGATVVFNAPGNVVIKTADFHVTYNAGVILTMGSPMIGEIPISPFSSLKPLKNLPEPIYDVIWTFPPSHWYQAEELDNYFNCFKVGCDWKDGSWLMYTSYWALPYIYSLGKIILYHHAPYEFGGRSPHLAAALRATQTSLLVTDALYSSFKECLSLIRNLLMNDTERKRRATVAHEYAMRTMGIEHIIHRLEEIFDDSRQR